MADSDSDAPSSPWPPSSDALSKAPPLSQGKSSSDPDTVYVNVTSFSDPQQPATNYSDDPSTQTSRSFSCTSHRIKIEDQGTFMISLSAHIRTNHEAEIIKLFKRYDEKFIETPNFELAMLELIQGEPAAVEAFKELFPTANVTPSPTSSTGFIRESCTYHDRVRAALYDDTFSYMRWLKNWIDYSRGALTFPEFKRNVELEAQFAKLADLWMEFDAKFAPRSDDDIPDSPSANFEDSTQDSSPGGAPSDSTDQEPASKRRKTE